LGTLRTNLDILDILDPVETMPELKPLLTFITQGMVAL
jgi:hypothetical protein